MAAGDLLTEEWHHEFEGLLVGPGCTWGVLKVAGWLDRKVSSGSVRYGQADGSAPGVDTLEPRIISLTLEGDSTSDGTTAFEAAAALEAAWPTGVDVELHALLPHLGHVFLVGRCQDLVFDSFDEATPLGDIQALATFEAADPTRHEVP